MPHAHIAGLGTAVPYPISTDRMLAKDREIRTRHGQSEMLIEQFAKFVEGTGVHTRHYTHPHWLPEGESPEDYPEYAQVSLTEDIFTERDFAPAHYERMQVFDRTVLPLARRAAERAIADWGGNTDDIGMVITTCTSGWTEPGIAIDLMNGLGLPLDCQKAELNFNGCFCGATCLRTAVDAVRAGSAKYVLVVAVEVASTHYDINATDLSSLVAHALFADGAAAVVVGEDGLWRYSHTGMSRVPDTPHLLQLIPPMDASHLGYRMTLNRRVGKALGEYFGEGPGADLLGHILSGLERTDRPALGIHPGGPSILDHVGGALYAKGWQDDALASSYDTLQSHGNLGAAAMLFVLARRLKSVEQDEVMTMAFGPGVTVEWATLARAA